MGLLWSNSKKCCLNDCQRKFFYTYAPQEAVETLDRGLDIIQLRSQKHPLMKRGSVIHSAISNAIDSLRAFGEVDYNKIFERFVSEWEVFESGNFSKESCGKKGSGSKFIKKCLMNLFESNLWNTIKEDIINCEILLYDRDSSEYRLSSVLSIEGVKCYFLPDLFYKVKGLNSFYLYDFKTGDHKPSDVDQICYYACMASEKYKIDPELINVRLVYIQNKKIIDSEDYSFSFNAQLKDKFIKDIIDSYSKINSCFSLIKNSQDHLLNFPVTHNPKNCRHCVFYDVCEESPLKGVDSTVKFPEYLESIDTVVDLFCGIE